MTAEALARIAGDTAAIAIALLGWFLHVKECRSTQAALREENKRLTDILSRMTERAMNHQSDQPKPGRYEERRTP